LILGAQPVDDAAFFVGGALGVEVDEAFEDFGVGEGGGPALGGEDGGVEVVVELLEEGDEALVVDEALFVGEGGRFGHCSPGFSRFWGVQGTA
jgi:hypothetical protein